MLESFSFVLSVSPEGLEVVSAGFVDASVPVDVESEGRIEDSVTSGGGGPGLCSSIGAGGGLVTVDGILGVGGRAVGLAVIMEGVEMGGIMVVVGGKGGLVRTGGLTEGAYGGM